MGASSIIGGIIILAVEARRDQAQVHQLEQVSLASAFWIGVAQCASLLPGMSRSGSTIIGGSCRIGPESGDRVLFFLALPTLIVATCYQMWKSRDVFRQEDYMALGIGMLVSFVVALIVIAAFLSFVKRIHSDRLPTTASLWASSSSISSACSRMLKKGGDGA